MIDEPNEETGGGLGDESAEQPVDAARPDDEGPAPGPEIDLEVRLRPEERDEIRALTAPRRPVPPNTSLRGRHVTTPPEWIGLAVIVLVGLLLVWRATPSPTGIPILDVIETALLVVLMVLAGSRARRWALIVGAMCVAAAGTGVGIVAGVTALLVTGYLVFTDRRSRVLGGAVGGLIAISALDLPTQGLGGATAFLSLAAFLPVLTSGYRNAPSQSRRSVRNAAIIVVASIGLLVAVSVLLSAPARREVARAVDETNAGMTAISDGDEVEAEARFTAAAEAFQRADQDLRKPWHVPFEAVPVLSQNYRAVREAAGVGRRVTTVLGDNVGEVHYDDLTRPEGGIDVDVLAGFHGPVVAVDAELSSAIDDLEGVESPWLVAPVEDRLLNVQRQFRRYKSETELAVLATTDGPRLLGADGTRRYLFLLGNPAEARDLGGHVGNWAEVTVDRGTIELVEVGGPSDLALRSTAAKAKDLERFPASLREMDPRRFPQNWGANPDLGVVAELSAELYEERTGRSIDGVAYADPSAFAAFLALTGPVQVADADPPTRVSSSNAVKFLTSDQFVRFSTERDGDAAVEELVRTVFDELTTLPLPGPRALGERFGPLVDQGRFAFSSLHEDDQALIDRMSLSDRLPEVQGANVLGVVNRNANPSKIDAYLQRATEATFDWDPETGDVTGTVEVTLTNRAPAGGLNAIVIGNQLGKPLGTNVTDLSVLTRFELLDVEVDGKDAPVRSNEEPELWRHTVRVEVPPGGSVTVRMDVAGSVRPGPRQRIELLGQPLVNEGTVRVIVVPSQGTVAGDDVRPVAGADDGRGRIESSDTSDRTFRLELEP